MDMKATMMLADHAQIADGKLFVSGGGWTWITAGSPFGIALLMEVPWDRLNEKHRRRAARTGAALPLAVDRQRRVTRGVEPRVLDPPYAARVSGPGELVS